MTKALKISYDEYSNSGDRFHNEDSLFCGERSRKGVFIVADGFGSDGSGTVASGVASRIMGRELGKTIAGTWSMRRAFEAADKELKNEQKKHRQGDIRTTVAALHIDHDSAFFGHCGDSRIYYFSGSNMPLITADHSVSYRKYIDGVIEYNDIPTDEDRHHLTESLGNPRVSPTLSKSKISLKRGDGFLLCTDGFWQNITDDEMFVDYIKSESTGRWLEFMLLRIMPRLREGADNLSAICVMME